VERSQQRPRPSRTSLLRLCSCRVKFLGDANAMVVAFKMIFSTRFVFAIVAITILLGTHVSAKGDTCSNIEPQPIGIDFGSSAVYIPPSLSET
jgi:hypothetical protein